MTHDELLTKIVETKTLGNGRANELKQALRAIVELHKAVNYTKEVYPDRNDLDDVLFCPACSIGNVTYYPCPTIQAIAEKLQ